MAVNSKFTKSYPAGKTILGVAQHKVSYVVLYKYSRTLSNQSQSIKSGSVTDSPSTMFPCLRKTLSSHHWQWTSLRNFFADSSACVGPLRTLTTTRTKCSNATASSTSMPLLQRAAALQHMVRNQNSSLTFFFPSQYHLRTDRSTWPPWLPPCVQPALCSTRCVRCDSRSDAGWRWETWSTESPYLWTSQRWCPGSGCFWRQRPGSSLPSHKDPSGWKIHNIKWLIKSNFNTMPFKILILD